MESETTVKPEDSLLQKATVYVAMYKAFKAHLATCPQCKFQLPSTMMHCQLGFFAGLNVKNAHEQLVGEAYRGA